jgi:hypothetical protein
MLQYPTGVKSPPRHLAQSAKANTGYPPINLIADIEANSTIPLSLDMGHCNLSKSIIDYLRFSPSIVGWESIMNRKTFLFIALLIVALNLGAADRVAEVEALPDSINLYPQVSYAQLELTIAGNDIYWQKKYGQGEAATFSTFDKALADGQYRFELIASPPYDEEAWEFARDNPELRHEMEVLERATTYRQTGRFEVTQGQIMLITDPDESAETRNNK